MALRTPTLPYLQPFLFARHLPLPAKQSSILDTHQTTNPPSYSASNLKRAWKMPSHFPSIQSFYKPTSTPRPSSTTPHSNQASTTINSSLTTSDGFTASEMTSNLSQDLTPWTPRQEYEEVEIAELTPGPGRVSFMGRVVNFYPQPMASKKEVAAKGYIKALVKDDSGAVAVSSLCSPHLKD